MSATAESFRSRWHERAARWARKRQGVDALPLSLQARRIYIVPTRLGLGYALLLVCMLFTGLNYTNSLTLLITFMFGALLLLGMHDCHRNLKHLIVTHVEADDAWAGQPGIVELRLDNRSRRPRQGLRLRCTGGHSRTFDVPPFAVGVHHADYCLPRRGRHELGRMLLATTAPLGLFRAWTWLHLPLQVIVYPQPAGHRPLPASGGETQSLSAAAPAGGDEEWAALRPFQPGDSPRSVAWKHYARGAPLLVAQYEGVAGTRRLLDYRALDGLDVEARLSQLADWVLRCEAQHEPYALQLPESLLPFGIGPEQQRAALRALAQHPGYRA
jgi:uncharacterized protein (DUF58 family)